MFENLSVLKMASAMAVHAGKKQGIAAQNVANADTPGYVGRDLPDFRTSYGSDSPAQRATRSNHLHGAEDGQAAMTPIALGGEASPNGNNVSLEGEIMKSASAKSQHDRALAIYRSALNVLRTSSK
ncbi:hypothetical protein C1J03_22945 [Sulfitobacter sp. SK012]|uniref:FlgB family protein n=1 Tax=Sulfitobacter sp. SK012 TaxID=1389005 RepID=UPI000E0BD659|nr:FlgB family protein [Sulfitobacter sp. SK012]AXI48602.1 hypothetical protein C1J03_22945 [Sulfitobacter sp. SK012]